MIFKIERRKRRKDGKLKLARLYSLRYRIGDMPSDKWHALGTTDKTVANSKAAQFISDLEREMAGLAIPKKQLESAHQSIATLAAEYVAELTTRGRDAKYIDTTGKRIKRISVACGWSTLRDVSGDSFMTWRRAQTVKGKTLNDCLCDVRTFFEWLVGLGRMPANPLSKVPRIAVKDDEEEKRRALPGDEAERLFKVSGPRTLIYQLTLYCGLRRDEVSELVWGDVQVARDGATHLKLRASTVKNGKTTLQPVPPWLAELLTAHRPKDAKLAAKVFRTIPRMPRFFKDLDAAGIPRVDERGHVTKFHSLRHTLGTWLWATGADPRSIMKVMRHSSLELTVRRYTDEAGLASTDAVAKLTRYDSGRPDLTQISAQIADFPGPILSPVVAFHFQMSDSQPVQIEPPRPSKSRSVATGQLVHAVGFEPTENLLKVNRLRGRYQPWSQARFSQSAIYWPQTASCCAGWSIHGHG